MARRKAKRQDVTRGTRLALPAGVAARYAAKLQWLADQMTSTTQRELTALFKHPDFEAYFATHAAMASIDGAVGMDAMSPASQARILSNKLKAQFEDLFREHAKPDAEQMVDEADTASKASTGRSLTKLSKGLTFNFSVEPLVMKEFKKAVVAENVRLIKSIPADYFNKVQGAVLRSITNGRGLADLVPFFEDAPGEQSRRSKNIAHDQTHKAYNGLNKVRMQQAGVQQFEWVHSGGGLHPREHHLDRWPDGLNGGIFSFAKLPIIDEATGERGIPGQAINCRCTMVPVMKFSADDSP